MNLLGGLGELDFVFTGRQDPGAGGLYGLGDPAVDFALARYSQLAKSLVPYRPGVKSYLDGALAMLTRAKNKMSLPADQINDEVRKSIAVNLYGADNYMNAAEDASLSPAVPATPATPAPPARQPEAITKSGAAKPTDNKGGGSSSADIMNAMTSAINTVTGKNAPAGGDKKGGPARKTDWTTYALIGGGVLLAGAAVFGVVKLTR